MFFAFSQVVYKGEPACRRPLHHDRRVRAAAPAGALHLDQHAHLGHPDRLDHL